MMTDRFLCFLFSFSYISLIGEDKFQFHVGRAPALTMKGKKLKRGKL